MTAPSQTPTRFPNGVNTDFPWQPTADYGLPPPMDYHMFFDDFEVLNAYNASTDTGGLYAVTLTGTSAAAAAQAGDGGSVLLTTGTASGNVTVITPRYGTFVLPTTPKKVFWGARLQLSDKSATGFYAGLTNVATTIAGITDGIYFSKAAAATTMYLNIVSGSTSQAQIAIPAASFTAAVVNATYFDLAFYLNRSGDVIASIGQGLFGNVPQQQTLTSAGQTTGLAGQVAYRAGVSGALTFTTANLAPMLLATTGATAQPTMTVDFQFAAKER